MTSNNNIDDDNSNNNNKEHWYDHVPKSVEVSHEGKFTMSCKQQVRTDRTIPNNKPDVITCDNKKGTYTLIDVAIPEDRNVIKKDDDKISKYNDLITEIQHMCNVKGKVMPVTTEETGTISKSLRQYLSNIPGKHEIKKLQKQPY